MPANQHLTLAQRKALRGREAILRGSTPYLALSDAENGADYLLGERNRLLVSVSAPVIKKGRPENSVPLDAFMRQVADEVEAAAMMAKTKKEDFAFEALKAIHKELISIECARCSRSRICDGGLDDDQIVTNYGGCIQTFTNLFRFVVQEAEAWYRLHVPNPIPFLTPEVRFETAFHSEPHRKPIAKHIGGSTFCEPGPKGDGLGVLVRLYLNVAEIDWESLTATPYILFHEIFSHAYQGIQVDAKPRRDTDRDDSFAEGWMDWVAARAFDVTLREGPESASSVPYTSEDFETGEALRRARVTPRPEDDRKTRGAMAYLNLGSQAASRFFDFLHQLYPALAARHYFFEISFAWNIQRDHERRQTFVSGVHARLRTEDPLRRKPLADAVRKYLQSKDLNDLIVS